MASPHLNDHLSGIIGILSRLCGISDNFMAPSYLTDHFSGTTDSLYRLCNIFGKIYGISLPNGLSLRHH